VVSAGRAPQGVRLSGKAAAIIAGAVLMAVVASSAVEVLTGPETVSTDEVDGTAPGGVGDVVETSEEPYDVLVSTSSDRANPLPIDGRTVAGGIFVLLGPESGIDKVAWYLDEPAIADADVLRVSDATSLEPPRQLERSAPFDFAGGSTATASAFDTTSLTKGSHLITAVVDLDDGSARTVNATFVTSSSSSTPTTAAPGPMPSRASLIEGAGLSDESILEPSDGLKVTTDGAIIENLDIRGNVVVDANNVTFRNTRFTYDGAAFGIKINDDQQGTTFEHCEINLINANAGVRGGTGRTMRYCEISGHADGVKIHSNELYEYNYIHMAKPDGSGKHLDGMQNSGNGSNVVIRRNVIDVPKDAGGNAAIFTQTNFGPVDNVLIEQNYLNGGNYTLFIFGEGETTDVRVLGNRFGRDHRYGVRRITAFDVQWSGNVWDDTGQPIE
jgi:hypothetical protein